MVSKGSFSPQTNIFNDLLNRNRFNSFEEKKKEDETLI